MTSLIDDSLEKNNLWKWLGGGARNKEAFLNNKRIGSKKVGKKKHFRKKNVLRDIIYNGQKTRAMPIAVLSS